MLMLNNLTAPAGSHRNVKRLGRGIGSGQGRRGGKGDKGQKARKSGHVRLGFEGGSIPIYMRLPKRNTFKNEHFQKVFTIVNLSDLNRVFVAGSLITADVLVKNGLISSEKKSLPVKVLARIDDTEKIKKFSFLGIKHFSAKAKELVRSVGGTIEGQ